MRPAQGLSHNMDSDAARSEQTAWPEQWQQWQQLQRGYAEDAMQQRQQLRSETETRRKTSTDTLAALPDWHSSSRSVNAKAALRTASNSRSMPTLLNCPLNSERTENLGPPPSTLPLSEVKAPPMQCDPSRSRSKSSSGLLGAQLVCSPPIAKMAEISTPALTVDVPLKKKLLPPLEHSHKLRQPKELLAGLAPCQPINRLSDRRRYSKQLPKC
eukprot:TRINITY_DN28230_c0_g1_i1.p1 TRINITY_DN28230_c0_g1~~TRINITY_DN28230_c0_g1_i1.p1  ORF type:complete len:214 (+),score=36.22 TRINITY_DN28230_c0_g1_i1:51-692(+)